IRQTLLEVLRILGDCEVVVARELTKAHEELVRGPISTVLGGRLVEKGEVTVVLDLGLKINLKTSDEPEPEGLLAELGELTNELSLSRRNAIGQLAKRYGLPANNIYAAIERAKKSVERPT